MDREKGDVVGWGDGGGQVVRGKGMVITVADWKEVSLGYDDLRDLHRCRRRGFEVLGALSLRGWWGLKSATHGAKVSGSMLKWTWLGSSR